MRLREKIETALDLCGFQPPRTYRKIGEGAWHHVYLAHLRGGDRLVVRIKKQEAYGRDVPFDETEFRSEYEAIGLYYRQANRCLSGVCPTTYEFHIDPGLTFTIESYMGRPLSPASLSRLQAFA